VVLQVLAVTVPLVVAGLQFWRWPTLERRVRAHVELVKELPEGSGLSFRAAVEAELEELARETQRRLANRLDWKELGGRLTSMIVFFGIALYMTITAGLWHPSKATGWRSLWVMAVYLLVLLVGYAVLEACARVVWRRMVRWARVNPLPDPPPQPAGESSLEQVQSDDNARPSRSEAPVG